MNFYSTNKKSSSVSAKTAVLRGLAEDGGLYMPETIPQLSHGFLENLDSISFQEIACKIAANFLSEEISESSLQDIVNESLTFDAPLAPLNDTSFVLELFHGPTLSFKDFGARFMARLMSHFNKDENKEITILVATSGDTGSAVASGFYQVEGTRVVLLYPSGKVSNLQEQQLTTLGQNITALEVEGTFDDCQKLVKDIFIDSELRSRMNLTSANSINIGRLIPQSFYYFHAAAQLKRLHGKDHPPLVFSVPSGNFGNLTAGLIACRMGLAVEKFAASTNENDVVVDYLRGGVFKPRKSKKTLSNAMDVGNPSNFARMLDLFDHSHTGMSERIFGHASSDQETKEAIKEVFDRFRYIIDPHGAVGYLGLCAGFPREPERAGIILETAHPAKFPETMESLIPTTVELPERLAAVLGKKKRATSLSHHYKDFKAFLLNLR